MSSRGTVWNGAGLLALTVLSSRPASQRCGCHRVLGGGGGQLAYLHQLAAASPDLTTSRAVARDVTV
jgi:hypothetical protein